jgi:threonine aldolase
MIKANGLSVLILGLFGTEGLHLRMNLYQGNTKAVDLRSDTVTRPSLAMRTAMFEAEVGDDVFGDDPTVQILEDKVSKMFEKEAALFFPTGTMSNLAATMSWCSSRGSEVILGDKSHIFLFEQGGSAQIAGVSSRTLPNNPDGTIDIDQIEEAIRRPNIHFPMTELISIENTHNFCGGRVLPNGYVNSLSALAKQKGIPLHLDGARIWNAATATDTPLAELVRGVDSASVCLSKGLGAPVGSLLIGPTSLIKKARRIRKVLGGGMRQVRKQNQLLYSRR